MTLQFLVKKLREQRPWKVKKIAFSLEFRVLQLPKKFILGDCETLTGQNGKVSKNSINFKKK
jgi:hypothetical protein